MLNMNMLNHFIAYGVINVCVRCISGIEVAFQASIHPEDRKKVIVTFNNTPITCVTYDLDVFTIFLLEKVMPNPKYVLFDEDIIK